ncbi:MAG TPA: carboxymuconolactone decarboxylase family protein [Yinghuangia sp.]|nr:carboxymuconolactone decarboxylase family protein [Yinghuangia sp.]
MTSTEAPRLAPLPARHWSPNGRELLRGHIPSADAYLADDADESAMPGVIGLFGHHPRLAARWIGFSGGLTTDPELPPRDRELLVLRVAWRTQSRYEWTEHVRIGRRAGLDDDEIAAIGGAGDDPGWGDRERALIAAADQMVAAHTVDEPTWRCLARHFDERQLLEVLFVIGGYLCLAAVLNAVGLPPDGGPDRTPIALPPAAPM